MTPIHIVHSIGWAILAFYLSFTFTGIAFQVLGIHSKESFSVSIVLDLLCGFAVLLITLRQ